jgi:hypothetical protein
LRIVPHLKNYMELPESVYDRSLTSQVDHRLLERAVHKLAKSDYDTSGQVINFEDRFEKREKNVLLKFIVQSDW